MFRSVASVKTAPNAWASIVENSLTGEIFPTGLTHRAKSAADSYSRDFASDWSDLYPRPVTLPRPVVRRQSPRDQFKGTVIAPDGVIVIGIRASTFARAARVARKYGRVISVTRSSDNAVK